MYSKNLFLKYVVKANYCKNNLIVTPFPTTFHKRLTNCSPAPTVFFYDYVFAFFTHKSLIVFIE